MGRIVFRTMAGVHRGAGFRMVALLCRKHTRGSS
jgi:hypothetical protein